MVLVGSTLHNSLKFAGVQVAVPSIFRPTHTIPSTVSSHYHLPYAALHCNNRNRKNLIQLSMSSTDGNDSNTTTLNDTNATTTQTPTLSNAFKSLPNMLTISRIVMVPFFMLALVLNKKSLGIMIYLLSCLTDFLDGFIARKWNLTSNFGAFLDPVADKLMVSSALILLVCQIPVWWFACPVAIIICREIIISALREWMAQNGKKSIVKVGFLGKIKTASQMISTALLLVACPGASNFDITLSIGLPIPVVFSAGILLLYISTLLTVSSGYLYLKAAYDSFQS